MVGVVGQSESSQLFPHQAISNDFITKNFKAFSNEREKGTNWRKNT
jgi:hypothetical protein